MPTLESPTEVEGKRVSALPRSNTRVQALLNALIGCHLICGGFRNKELKGRMAQLLGKDERELSTGQMSYDLQRLKGHGLIIKIEGTHRYEVTEEGLRLAMFIGQVERRVYQVGLSEICGKANEEMSGAILRAQVAYEKAVAAQFDRRNLDRAA